MSVFGFFHGKKTTIVPKLQTSYLQRELTELKEYVRSLDRKDRVSKRQRQELLARVFTTLDLAEKSIQE